MNHILKHENTEGRVKKLPSRELWTVLLLIAAAFAIILTAAAVRREGGQAESGEEPQAYPVRGFSAMCPFEGKVYRGANGVYGEPIALKTSIFTMQDEYIYYVEKVQEAYESMTDELLSIRRSDRNGENSKELVDDVFLAGAGHEKLIGDRLFYALGYDDNYRMEYAAYDLNTGEKKRIASDRIDNIIGYDGSWLYYAGYDTQKEESILGRINLKSDRDETLVSCGNTDEEGFVDTALYENGRLYCLTLTDKPEGYDYRTYTYRIQVRSAETGKLMEELPFALTGSANYSMLVQDGKLYYTGDVRVMEYDLSGEEGTGESRLLTQMKPEEYWGILHFAPGDGYLYYEAIAETDEETGNNDYFYRLPLQGGEPELLAEWFTQ